jgi:outer membrane protein TolC
MEFSTLVALGFLAGVGVIPARAIMPSGMSQPGAPPPAITTPESVHEQISPIQPGVPTMQPTYPTSQPPVKAPGSASGQIASPNPQSVPTSEAQPPPPNVIAPPMTDEAPITLFDNQPSKQQTSGGSDPWSALLNASVTKERSIPIDLPSVLKLVEAQNLPLAQSRVTSKMEDLAYYRLLGNLLPDILATYTQSRFQGSILVFGNSTVNSYQTRIIPQVAASWVINPGGQDVFLALAAKQRAKGAKFSVLDTMNTQLSVAAIQYYDLLSSEAQVENAQLSIRETEAQVKLNEARMNSGVGTKLDLERARSQLLARQQILIDAENTLARSQQGLLNILNLDPSVQLTPTQMPVQAHPLVPFDLTTEQLVSRALINNPTLQISAMELKALKDESKAALGSFLPSLTLQSYIGGLGSELHQLGLTRFGGLTLQTNLLSNMGTAVPLDYATSRLAVKREQLIRSQQIRDTETLVINAYLDSRSSVKAILAAQEQLSVSQEAYRLALGRFQAGLGINVDVLNAQTALAASRTLVVRTLLSFNQAQVRLLTALGDATPPHIINGIPASVFTPHLSPKSPKKP